MEYRSNISDKMMPKDKGFTLIELLVSVAIFSIVSIVALSSVLVANDVARKIENRRSVIDNLNFALESMARRIRLGDNYKCEPSGICPSASFSFSKGTTIFKYSWIPDTDGKGRIVLEKKVLGEVPEPPIDVTAGEVDIQNLTFYAFGINDSSRVPRVTIVVKGVGQSSKKLTSNFTVQTTVSRRVFSK